MKIMDLPGPGEVPLCFNLYHIANLVPVVFDAKDTGDWRCELLHALRVAHDQLRIAGKTGDVLRANDGRAFRRSDGTGYWEEVKT